MRYLIEPKNKKGEGIIEEILDKEKSLKLIDKYDAFEKVSAEVEKIGLALRRFKKSGIDWSVFEYYLRGRGVPQATIDGVVGKVEDFFKKIGILSND
jgi:hypothetical protein